MDEETARKILAAKRAQELALQERFFPAPAVEQDAVPAPAGEIPPPGTETDDPVLPPKPDAVSLPDQVTELVDEYIAATEEIDRQRERLIALRGGEASLTEDDQLLLDNIRDLVLFRYERLLER